MIRQAESVCTAVQLKKWFKKQKWLLQEKCGTGVKLTRHLAIVFLGTVMSGKTNGGPQGMNRAPMVNGVSGEKSEVQITNVIYW